MTICKLLRPFTYTGCLKCSSQAVYVDNKYMCIQCFWSMPYTTCITSLINMEMLCRRIKGCNDMRYCRRLIQCYMRWYNFEDTTIYDNAIIAEVYQIIHTIDVYDANIGHDILTIIEQHEDDDAMNEVKINAYLEKISSEFRCNPLSDDNPFIVMRSDLY